MQARVGGEERTERFGRPSWLGSIRESGIVESHTSYHANNCPNKPRLLVRNACCPKLKMNFEILGDRGFRRS